MYIHCVSYSYHTYLYIWVYLSNFFIVVLYESIYEQFMTSSGRSLTWTKHGPHGNYTYAGTR